MAQPLDVISHWHHSVENLTASSQEFFDSVTKTLTDKTAPVQPKQIEWAESGFLSAKRMYLRVTYQRFVFDISAFPFGKDFYFSWWMGKRLPGNILMFGCGFLIAVPVVLAICVAIAGFIGGFALFVVVLGVGFFAIVSNSGEMGASFEDTILTLPILGPVYERLFRPATYHSEDSRIMFEETVHRVVLGVVSGILTVNEMAPLTAAESTPKTRRTLL